MLDYKINVTGNNILYGSEKSGTIMANREKTVRLGFTTIAIGQVKITITAGIYTKEYKAFALGPFYLFVKELQI